MRKSSKRGTAKTDSKSRATHAKATFTTARAILISQWTDHFIVGIGDGEGRCQRRSWRHRQCRPHHSQPARGETD
jgi:hypothetical protein